jgi:hypothetical protein
MVILFCNNNLIFIGENTWFKQFFNTKNRFRNKQSKQPAYQ